MQSAFTNITERMWLDATVGRPWLNVSCKSAKWKFLGTTET